MKRDKICISWCGALSAVAMMLAVALGSCTKEPLDGDMQHPGNELPAGMICIDFSGTDSQRLDTRADELQTTEEKRIVAADIFFYGTTEGGNKGELVKRVSTSDEGVDLLADSKIVIPNIGLETKEAYEIVVVANGGTDFTTDDLTVGSSIDVLTHKITAVTDIALLKTPLLMSGVVDSHIFSNNPIAKIDMVRQVVKLNVTVKLSNTFTETYHSAQFGGRTEAVGKADLSIWNLPSHSFVMSSNIQQLPSESKMLPAIPNEMLWNATTKEWKFTTYAYANPVQGKDANAKNRSTQFIFQLPYRLTLIAPIVTDNYYKIYIDDTNNPFNPYMTIHNTIYNVAVTVNGFGSEIPDYPGGLDMTVTTNVLPWNVVEKAPEMGGYVKFARTTFTKTGEMTETALQEGGNLPEDGGTVKIYCKTNVGGWYVIVRDHGKIVQNTKSTPTRVVTKETEQSLDIAIPAIDYLDGRYTVSIHHPAYASELINQIPPITFTQYGGFIPNSELLKTIVIDDNTTIGSWPENKLPPRGLQIAKTGNVLPTGAAKADDPKMQWRIWSNDFGHTDIQAEGLGEGKGNYALMTTLDAVNYPIGQACKDLGTEWYVPSTGELRLIYNNKGTLGTSYSFTSDSFNNSIYWSSAESISSPTGARGLDFYYGGMGDYFKHGGTIRVRCVRNI